MANSKRGLLARITGPVLIFVLMVAVFAIASRRFFTLSNAANIIRQGSVLALAAFGQTFVILLGGIDLRSTCFGIL